MSKTGSQIVKVNGAASMSLLIERNKPYVVNKCTGKQESAVHGSLSSWGFWIKMICRRSTTLGLICWIKHGIMTFTDIFHGWWQINRYEWFTSTKRTKADFCEGHKIGWNIIIFVVIASPIIVIMFSAP